MSGADPLNFAVIYDKYQYFISNLMKVFKLIMDLVFITETSLTIFSLSLTWIVLTILYRLFLKPIANIPVPTLAALTSWYECYYDVIKPGRYVWKIKELHKQYGWFIMSLKSIRSKYFTRPNRPHIAS